MRRSRCLPLLLLTLALEGCVHWRLPPLNPQAHALGIPEERKLPLRVAVVVPDPMGFRFMISFMAKGKPLGRGGKPQDWTGKFGGEQHWHVAPELARVSAAGFSQVFAEAVSLRAMPQPGEYDAVIEARVSQITLLDNIKPPSRRDGELALDWKLTVFDREGIELLSRQDIEHGEVYDAYYWFMLGRYNETLGNELSKVLGALAKRWAELVYNEEAVKAYAARVKGK